MSQSKHISIATLAAWGALSIAAAAIVAVLGAKVFATQQSDAKSSRGWSDTPPDTKQTVAAQADRLAHYGWIDRTKGTVAIPIERAMSLVVDELGRETPKEPVR